MTHITYVVASYVISALVLTGMITWILLDQRAQRSELQRLEAQGVRRRSRRTQEDGAGNDND
ncbi:heme exporter protein D [Paenochrobactrum gallinarii]|uniref:Heme exporter protein D n=1 Tax=Paenochrobactrum gallinarii TaxID=643673 RepID=A0A841M6L0_9HYPH|nr:heme exporter protein CcmD [Paenochrobactrum gallinarii]MBB6261204.1 heme exporter protein D [Paenochrobactrum gallinarii]